MRSGSIRRSSSSLSAVCSGLAETLGKRLGRKGSRRMLFAAVPLLLSAAISAYGASVTFDFNSLASYATDAQIQTYMNQTLATAGCTGCGVTLTGAVADQTYNGDGHVTGPGTTSASKSLTLGTSDHATASNTGSTLNSTYDTFIANTNDGATQISTMITMKFTGFTINGAASFDYEVFPDGSPNQPPDLIFQAGNSSAPNGNDPVVITELGVAPGTTNGTAIHSPFSGTGTESAQQAIGTWTGTLTSVTSLDFVDWPATIGVDNLKVSWNTSVPEPSSILLLATVASGLLLRKKLKKT